MAKADFRIPDDFLNRLSRLEERTGDVIPEVLEAGAKSYWGKRKATCGRCYPVNPPGSWNVHWDFLPRGWIKTAIST